MGQAVDQRHESIIAAARISEHQHVRLQNHKTDKKKILLANKSIDLPSENNKAGLLLMQCSHMTVYINVQYAPMNMYLDGVEGDGAEGLGRVRHGEGQRFVQQVPHDGHLVRLRGEGEGGTGLQYKTVGWSVIH